jgi:Tfp pilus assembly protein PilX
VTSTALALLAIGVLEPQISRNLADAARARGLAEAGVEVAYGRLGGADADTANTILAAAAPRNPWVTLTQAATPDGADGGTYTVRIRNDLDPTDSTLTGRPAGAEAGETADRDGNGVLIVQSTGAFRRAHVTIEGVLRRLPEGVLLFNRRELPEHGPL